MMKQTAIGVDYGIRKVAVACPSSGLFNSVEFTREKNTYVPEDDILALMLLSDWLYSKCWNIKADIVVIESAIQGASRNIRTGLLMSRMQGSLMAEATRLGIETIEVAPAKWKKEIVGKGTASKIEVSTAIKIRYPEYYKHCEGDQDITDATAISLYGEKILERRRQLHRNVN